MQRINQRRAIMLIGFTSKTSKLLPKLLCIKFRHCAIITMWSVECGVWNYLFIHKVKNGIHILELTERDLKILEQNGWVFINCEMDLFINYEKLFINSKSMVIPHSTLHIPHFITCVGFAKRALGINNPFIWTPDQLYRYLKRANGAFF